MKSYQEEHTVICSYCGGDTKFKKEAPSSCLRCGASLVGSTSKISKLESEISIQEMAVKGNVEVNLPVVIIIFSVAAIASILFDLSWMISIFIGLAVSFWIAPKLTREWTRSCLKKGATKEDIFIAGKRGFINYDRKKVFDVTLDNASPLPPQ